MSITPLKFTGISSFSEDFQTILSRAVSIASLPVQQLQNNQSELLSKKQALGTLRGAVSSLAISVESLANIGANRGLSVSSSNTSRVTVTNNGVSGSGVYRITDVTSVAAAANENTAIGLATPDATQVDADGALELVTGTGTYAIQLTSETNNLTGLRDAINNSGAGVTATLINSGAGPAAYYLSLTTRQTGATTLALNGQAGVPATNLLTSSNQGANAEFSLNGIPISRADNTISDVIDGLTLNMLAATEPGEEVTITASSSRASLANGINEFVKAYNSAAQAVNQHIGEQAGILSGDSILRQAQGLLREVTGYQGAGLVSSLAAIGIELDKTGTMSFDAATFYSLSTAQFEAALDFMGTTTTGFGALAKRLDQISNPYSGLIQKQQESLDTADTRIDEQIATITERISLMQSSLAIKLQQADLLISQFSSQQSQLEAVILSLNAASFGKRDK